MEILWNIKIHNRKRFGLWGYAEETFWGCGEAGSGDD